MSEATYKQAWAEATAEVEKLKGELSRLKRDHEVQGRKLEGLQGAVDELMRDLDQFFDDENRTIWDIKTAMALVRNAR